MNTTNKLTEVVSGKVIDIKQTWKRKVKVFISTLLVVLVISIAILATTTNIDNQGPYLIVVVIGLLLVFATASLVDNVVVDITLYTNENNKPTVIISSGEKQTVISWPFKYTTEIQSIPLENYRSVFSNSNMLIIQTKAQKYMFTEKLPNSNVPLKTNSKESRFWYKEIKQDDLYVAGIKLGSTSSPLNQHSINAIEFKSFNPDEKLVLRLYGELVKLTKDFPSFDEVEDVSEEMIEPVENYEYYNNYKQELTSKVNLRTGRVTCPHCGESFKVEVEKPKEERDRDPFLS
ncbi:MAG TPA: hypothetical protein PLP35_07095 [Caldisericia bacterium]|nr:hypothetical protein [Caldisericia bacterium]HRV75589.1 hypothetical protein [Caldisericia bacterium]